MHLTPITRRAKNAVSRVKCPHWDRVTWAAIERRDTVLFSDKPGPWALVVPVTLAADNNALAVHSRWVHLASDPDFAATAGPDVFVDHAGQRIPFNVRLTRADETTGPGQWLTCEVNPHGDAWQPMARAKTTGEALRKAIAAWNEFDQRT